MKLLGKSIIGILLVIGSLWLYFSFTYPDTPPLQSLLYFAQSLLSPHENFNRQIIGFLPYWRLDNIPTIRLNALSEINYFSLSVAQDGHILKEINGQNDPGWNGWIQQKTKALITKAHIMDTQVTVTITAQDNQLIESILDNKSFQQHLISDTLEQIRQRRLNGVNIDFEYSGEPDRILQQEFTTFSKNLAIQLRRQDKNALLELSIMPLSARQKDLYDFSHLVPMYDRFIGMSYDYYGQNSDIAGPVAPMDGFKQGTYFFDVTTTYADYLKDIPKNKLVMGIPTYGWEWAVENGKIMKSKTFPPDSPDNYAAVISYARAREDKNLLSNQCYWDPLSEETWCWFKDKQSGIDHQAWIVDNRSLQVRFDYANQHNLGGIALWTLGLDKTYPDIWERLQGTFGR